MKIPHQANGAYSDRTRQAYPVELLRDGAGIYGIGARETEMNLLLPTLLLRRDYLKDGILYHHHHSPVLQMITGGFRHGMFKHTTEEQLRSTTFIALLLKVLRALQLAVTFPVLAFAIFGGDWHPLFWGPMNPDFPDSEALDRYGTVERIRDEAAALIEAGASLKTIADLMRVPMSFRKIKPGAADWTLSFIAHGAWDKRLISVYMPNSLPRMKLWLSAIHRSSNLLNRDFIEWVVKHALEIPGSAEQVINSLLDIKDWVRACQRARIPRLIRNSGQPSIDRPSSRGEEFVVRPFSPDMSLRTVLRLSGNWHEAVANNMDGPDYEFPEPWCDGGHSGGYDIIPITNNGDLYREGHAMHHCVGTQGDLVRCGSSYFYSVREQGVRIATVELLNRGGGVIIGDLRGVCNGPVSKAVRRCVERWLYSKKEFDFPDERKVAKG